MREVCNLDEEKESQPKLSPKEDSYTADHLNGDE